MHELEDCGHVLAAEAAERILPEIRDSMRRAEAAALTPPGGAAARPPRAEPPYRPSSVRSALAAAASALILRCAVSRGRNHMPQSGARRSRSGGSI